jgi:AraC-like DNA-binding protein
MAQFISLHFQQPITISDVAASVSLHPRYAMAVFKAGFDMTLIDYLNQQRIAYVQQQLLTTDANVIDIAYDAGFQTISHFYTAFKQLCGMPPGKYRAALLRSD